ncbi:MAG: YeeE/YedE family protein [Phycisphaeraceae bacterium]|nr:YeeE/YedE family protein [Phycisphaerales bacterium]MCB9860436.1 YeeE/YedE family protein [Phycisphaeraceae bacterium]
MKNPLTIPRWSPYAVGASIGVLSWITFVFMGKALGASTTAVRAAGAVERVVAKDHAENSAYIAKYLGSGETLKPVFDWQFMLVIALAIGAFIAARLAHASLKEHVPAIWTSRFGSSRGLRYGAAFLGGIILIIGARMAGGCTSGHGISGGLQLSTSAYVFMAAMFLGGVPTALLLYGRKGAACAVPASTDSTSTTEVTNA